MTNTKCTRTNLCSDCDDATCIFSGNLIADCPKYHCDMPDPLKHDCEHCTFLKRYQEEMRKYYRGEK